MKNFLILTLIILVLGHIISAQILPELEKVKSIKLLESTRDDVRRILGDYKLKVSKQRDYEDAFETANAEIEVSYSNGKCKSEDEDFAGWNVPEWTITYVTVTPKNTLTSKEIGLNLTKFKKEQVYKNVSDLYIYHKLNEGIGYQVNKNGINEINFIPPKNKYPLLCSEKEAKKAYSNKSWFIVPLKERVVIMDYFGPPADVENLIISVPEITASCSSSNSKSCSDGVKIITVFTIASNPQNDMLTYNYQVSGGKILNYGDSSHPSEKALWDLSGVKPGTYTITAASDNGCGFCGKMMTKTVIVKECPDCN